MRSRKVFTGVLFILAAVLLILTGIGTIDFKFSIILGTLVFAPIFVNSIYKRRIQSACWSAALLLITYNSFLEKNISWYPEIAWYVILFAGIFLGIGLSTIFKPHFKRKDMFSAKSTSDDQNEIYVNTKFNGSTRYVTSTCLRRAEIDCSFGALEIYFTNAQVSPDGAMIYVDGTCAAIEMYMPSAWNVSNELKVSTGALEEGTHSPDPLAPKVTLRGGVSLGAIEIKYI